MSEHNLRQLYMIVAGSGDRDDFVKLLDKLANDAADVRVRIPNVKNDSLEIRQAIYDYLKQALDNIRRAKDNNVRTPSSVGDDE